MDCIRVELRDCSLTETRVDEYLTILYDNNPEDGQSPSAGLMIKGIKHLFNEWRLPLEGILRVTDIFDKMAKKYPQILEDHISQIVKDIELTVNLDEAAEAA